MATNINLSIKSHPNVKKALYILLSFLMSFLLLCLSLSVLLEFTIFNKDFVMGEMNNSGYFAKKNTEIKRGLIDLGYASGINDEDFFNDLFDESLLRDDTTVYLNNFYSGKGSVISTDNFKEIFENSLNEYIEENNFSSESINKKSLEYLINNASKIYSNSLELPLLNSVAGYFLGIKKVLPITIGVLAVLTVLTGIIFVFSNRWKHRAARYMCYTTTTVFLTTLFPAIVILASEKIEHINITSMATYSLVVSIGNTLVFWLFGVSLFFALASVGLYIIYRYLYPKQRKEFAFMQ
ncbi:MAG: hypothetical protein UH239_02955 [Acutalibacteraceae bacterium]|nr:hypothetical protein [Acutalibacteraceae bacterium]